MNTDELELPAAIRELDDAVHALIGVRVHRDQHGVFTAPGLLTELARSLRERARFPGTGARGYESQPPIWIVGEVIMMEVEGHVRGWRGEFGLDREHLQTTLSKLPTLGWAPPQVDRVRELARVIGGWASRIDGLLSDTSSLLDVRNQACPAVLEDGECGQLWVWRHEDDVNVRKTALVMQVARVEGGEPVVEGVYCRACATFWDPGSMRLLGRSLLEQEGAA